jgi:hypothetical protein
MCTGGRRGRLSLVTHEVFEEPLLTTRVRRVHIQTFQTPELPDESYLLPTFFILHNFRLVELYSR